MQNKGTIYNILVSPNYRILRHIVLIVAVIAIVFNQLSVIYSFRITFAEQLLIYIIPVTLSYLVAAYFNLYFLIPKYLFTKKYLHFIIGLLLVVFVLNIIVDVAEYIIYKVTNTPYSELSIFYENNLFIDMVFNTFTLAVCMMGIGAIVLLKEWMKESKNILQLEREILESEIEHLKEQIAPETLFKILNNTAQKARSNTKEASIILIRLSHVLRYQLYDCSRDKVLLKSEISFIDNYLRLLQMNFGQPEYKINIEGSVDMIFIPPLLFSSLLQVVIDKAPSNTILNIDLKVDKEHISFLCTANDYIKSEYLANIKQRLALLYGEGYTIAQRTDNIELKIRI